MYSQRQTGRLLGAVVLALVAAPLVQAQNRQPSGLPTPRLYVVAPAGARVGTSVEVTFAGLHLEEATRAVFSTPNIKAEPVPEPPPPIDPKTKKPRPRTAPPVVKFKVTVAANTPLGAHDVRLVNKYGTSNARAFVVGDLPEVAEVEPNNDITTAPNKPQRVELNTTVNGTFSAPNDVDYFVFKATRGQRVVVSCLASTTDSRAQPAVEIYSSKGGTSLAENVGYDNDDAVVDITAKEDGDYHVRVFTNTYTFRNPPPGMAAPGASDKHYRLTITTAPWIDAAVPRSIEPGKTVDVTVWGRNLPGGKLDPTARLDGTVLEKATVKVTAPATPGKLSYTGHVPPSGGFVNGFEFRLKNAAGSSNPFLMGLASAPVVVSAGADAPEKAQPVALPCEIAGAVEKRNDADWYKFTAKKGEAWNIQVISQQLGAPTFMTFSIRAAKGERTLLNAPPDPNTNVYSRRFFHRTDDPSPYRFVAPEDGDYQLLVTSHARGTSYGPRHTYAVRITRDEPDFSLIASGEEEYVPCVTTVPPGGSSAFNVIIKRHAGFSEEVELKVEGLPAGLTCPPQILAAGVRETSLAITAPDGAAAWSGPVRVVGTATINGKKATREARAAGLVWPTQPNGNTAALSRLERELYLCVAGKPVFTLTPTIDKGVLTIGDKATIKVKVVRKEPDAKGPIQVGVMQLQNRQGSELPQNLRINNNQLLNINAGQAEGSFAVTVGPNVPPGTYNVVFRGQTQFQFSKDGPKGRKQNVFGTGVSSPISITINPKALANFRLNTTNVNVKAGAQQEVTVSVTRQFGFKGEFKVSLVLPPGVAGVEAPEVVIPAGANDAKLVIKAPPGAPLGGKNNLIVRAVALWNGKVPVTHEARLNVNVLK